MSVKLRIKRPGWPAETIEVEEYEEVQPKDLVPFVGVAVDGEMFLDRETFLEVVRTIKRLEPHYKIPVIKWLRRYVSTQSLKDAKDLYEWL